MKTGRTITELAKELERQAAQRVDYLAAQKAVIADVSDQAELVIDGFPKETQPLALTPHAHGQLAVHLGIPARYYDRMRVEQPHLLRDNVNTWLKADPDNSRMFRTLDGRVRAVLSPRYRQLDNFELAGAVLPVLAQHKLDVISCEVTETRMYLKTIIPALSDELPNGLAYGTGSQSVGTDRGKVVAALVISNSEVGAGTLRIEPSVFTTFCTNLAILKDAAMKKYHVGRGWEANEDLSVYRDETRAADDAAFWMKVRDLTVAALNPERFAAAVAMMRAAAGRPITSDDLPRVVEVAVKELAMPKRTEAPILKFLASGGDLSQWGLASAITRVAGDQELTYEAATELEKAGGEVLALDSRGWEVLNKKAA